MVIHLITCVDPQRPTKERHSNELRNFLAIPYDELEELNLTAKKATQEIAFPPR